MKKKLLKIAIILVCFAFVLIVAIKEPEVSFGDQTEPETEAEEENIVPEISDMAEPETLPVELVNNPELRILITTDDFSRDIHDKVKVSSDKDFQLLGEDGTVFADYNAWEIIDLDSFRLETGETLIFKSEGTISIPSLKRMQGTPEYYGSLQIYKEEEGFCIINIVPMEKYLLTVVPSEMPSSYPIEALKSQAVCARTYAYQKMCSAGLPGFGAHVDDSTAFQVYHAQPEQTESTKAVKETQGITLFWEEQPAEVFYYSTSCGVGTAPDIWQEGNADKYPYLKSLSIKNEKTGSDFEENEPWYRWKYEVKNLNPDHLIKRFKTRYAADPDSILTKQEDGTFLSVPIKDPGAIKDMKITEKGEGNIAVSLIIEGEKEIFFVCGEYNIRYLLCDPDCEVIRNDGSSVKMATILPSAFFDMQVSAENGNVKGYLLEGGGYGHGVGMSQNAARQMALDGMDHQEILDFFFEGCKQADIYGSY